MHWVILIALGVLGLVVALNLLVRKVEKARTEALRQASVALGLAFEGEGNAGQIKGLADHFQRGGSRHVWNVMSGRAGTDAVKVFDYQYTVGSGKQSQTWKQTVALYPGGPGLPDFVLAAALVGVPPIAAASGTATPGGIRQPSAIEATLHKLMDAMGGPDIDFDSNPIFSARYALWGPDEAAIRAAFTPEIREFFEQEPGWTVEVQAGNVGIYRAGRRVKPAELATFLEQSRAVLRAFSRP